MGLRVGESFHCAGFFTEARYLRGQSAAELERRLGYHDGRLTKGWWLLFLEEPLGAADFAFRGYTHFSGGVEQGHLDRPPDARTAEQRLADGGFDLPRMKTRLVDEVFRLDGWRRLAKALPVIGDGTYPAGSGVPQWELTRPKRFRVRAFVKPGTVYDGDYA